MTVGNVYNLTENKASILKLEITLHFCKQMKLQTCEFR
jgi:hypothetical protein